jgi:transposase
MSTMDRATGNTTDAVSEIGEKAAQIAGDVKDRATGALGAVHAEVGDLQATVADTLESGAEAIRKRLGPKSRASGAGGVRGHLTNAGTAVAGRLDSSAYWLRENDLGDLGTFLHGQLKEHPGRTALIALGVGILIGRSSRR